MMITRMPMILATIIPIIAGRLLARLTDTLEVVVVDDESNLVLSL